MRPWLMKRLSLSALVGYLTVFLLGLLTQTIRGKGIGGNLGYVDHNIYLGYALSGPELKEQIGTLYYEFRIAWIFPLRLAIDFFGATGPIVLTRVVAALIPVTIVAIVRGCGVESPWLRSSGLALAFLVMAPTQAITAETYTAGASLLLQLVLCALLVGQSGQQSRSRSLAVGATVASLFALHEFNMISALFLLSGWYFFQLFSETSSSFLNRLIRLRLQTAFQALGLLVGLGMWEAIYSLYYRQGILRPGLVIGKLKIARELSELRRWEGYPGFFDTVTRSDNPFQFFVPLVAGILIFAMLLKIVLLTTHLRPLSWRRDLLLLSLATSHFASLLFAWLILHAPLFSEYFYFSLSLVSLLLLGVFVLTTTFWKIPTVLWLSAWMIAVIPSTTAVELLGVFSLDISKLEPDGYLVLLIALGVSFVALIEQWRESPAPWLALSLLLLWLPVAAGNSPYYLLNYYRGDQLAEEQYFKDVAALNEIWRDSAKLGVSAVWNQADTYLNSMQASLAFGSTRLDGLGGPTPLPSLDNWDCSRFWGARKLTPTCQINGNDLGQKPDVILAMYRTASSVDEAVNNVDEAQLAIRMRTLGYFFADKNLIGNGAITISKWQHG